ncbi:MAG: Hsp20/alpha crystallin family protein [Candidatus Hodarchaeales archaeon]|jgi:HSP20 family molecular chaperone IbpA
MNNNYDERKYKDFHVSCGFDPFKIFVQGFPGRKHPFFHKARGFSNYGYGGRAEIEKDDDAYTITFEVPGVSKEDIQLEITPDGLWLNAKNEELKKEYKNHFHFREPIDPEKVNARLKAGILMVTAPFANKKPKTKVNIE